MKPEQKKQATRKKNVTEALVAFVPGAIEGIAMPKLGVVGYVLVPVTLAVVALVHKGTEEKWGDKKNARNTIIGGVFLYLLSLIAFWTLAINT